jgi:hypothetical protein
MDPGKKRKYKKMSILPKQVKRDERSARSLRDTEKARAAKHLKLLEYEEPLAMKPLPDEGAGVDGNQRRGLRRELYDAGAAMSIHLKRLMGLV